MDEYKILVSQYHAALEMLKQTIQHCPETHWHHSEEHTLC